MSEVNLTTEQQLLVETRLNNEKKSTAVAYLLALFLGYFGTHNFYAGRYKLACFELGAFLFTTITFFGSGKNLIIADTGLASLLSSFFGYIVLLIIAVYDLFTLYGTIKANTNQKRERFIAELHGEAIPKEELSNKSKLINLSIVLIWIMAAIAINAKELNVARERSSDFSSIQNPVASTDISNQNQVTDYSQLNNLANATSNDIDPYGKIVGYFYNPKLTDLQRQDLQTSVDGSVVVWTLPVDEISEFFGKYLFTLYDRKKGSVRVEFSLDPKELTSEEVNSIKSLKIGDYLTVKGEIDYAGYASRSVFLKPVMLWDLDKEKKYAKTFGEMFPNFKMFTLEEGLKKYGSNQANNVASIFKAKPIFVSPADVFNFVDMAEDQKARQAYLQKLNRFVVEWVVPIAKAQLGPDGCLQLITETATKDGKFFPEMTILLYTTEQTIQYDTNILKNLKPHGMLSLKGSFFVDDNYNLYLMSYINHTEQQKAINNFLKKLNQ